MANTNIDLLTPELWSLSFSDKSVGVYPLHKLVSTKFENLIANYGDTVHVPLVPDISAADDWAPGDAITPTDITQEVSNVTLNKSKRKTINLNGKELSMSPYDLVTTYGVPMAQTILETLNSEIYKEMLKANHFIDGTTLTEDIVVDLKTKMDINKCAGVGRKLVMSPTDIGTLLKADAFQYANYSGDGGQVMREGQLIRKFGFDIMESHIIETYTPADLLGAIDNVAGYAAGTTTIAVDGFDDDANPIRSGDIFIIADEAGTPYHTVVSTTLTAGDTTGITFYPALVDAVADDQVVTITPTRSAISCIPSAMALAMRVYNMLPAGTGVQQTIVNYDGMPIRISVWQDAKLGINVQMDILFGCKLIHQERIARIII